jgi:hypothetical protein
MIEGLDTPKSAFHWSKDEMNDVLARPTVHVGNIRQANSWQNSGGKVNMIQFADHIQFHDERVDDHIANLAERQYQQEIGAENVRSVMHAGGRRSGEMTPVERDRLSRAVRALHEGKILPYRNTEEGVRERRDRRPSPDNRNTSWIVPNPVSAVQSHEEVDPRTMP